MGEGRQKHTQQSAPRLICFNPKLSFKRTIAGRQREKRKREFFISLKKITVKEMRTKVKFLTAVSTFALRQTDKTRQTKLKSVPLFSV